MRGRNDLSQFQDMEPEVDFTCIVNVTVKFQADMYFIFFQRDMEIKTLN